MERAKEAAQIILFPPDKDARPFITFSPQPVIFNCGVLSPVYMDLRKIQYFLLSREKIIQLMIDEIKDSGINFDAIASVANGGTFWGIALALYFRVGHVNILAQSKKHGLGMSFDGVIMPQKKYLMVEDVVSTGGSAIRAAETVRQNGGTVKDAFSLFTYEWAESKMNLEEAQLESFSLLPFSILFSQAKKTGFLQPETQALVADWIKDHHGWGKRHGFA